MKPQTDRKGNCVGISSGYLGTKKYIEVFENSLSFAFFNADARERMGPFGLDYQEAEGQRFDAWERSVLKGRGR